MRPRYRLGQTPPPQPPAPRVYQPRQYSANGQPIPMWASEGIQGSRATMFVPGVPLPQVLTEEEFVARHAREREESRQAALRQLRQEWEADPDGEARYLGNLFETTPPPPPRDAHAMLDTPPDARPVVFDNVQLYNNVSGLTCNL